LVGIGFGVMLDPDNPLKVIHDIRQFMISEKLNYSSVFCKAQASCKD